MPIATSRTIVEIDTQDLDDGGSTEEVAASYVRQLEALEGLEALAR